MKVVFCGFGRAGKECLMQLLLHAQIEASNILVYTHDTEENKDFVSFLHNLNITFKVSHINKDTAAIDHFKPDFLLSVYYRYIISDEILAKVSFRAMNLHPSLLPDYRGCFSSVWAILNGEKRTGVSFHYITSEIDGGNIILQKELPISKGDTAYSLYHKLISLFVQYFLEACNLLFSGNSGLKQLETGRRRYYSRELPFNGMLKASETEYDLAVRFFKAMYFPPFPNAVFEFEDLGSIEIKDIQQLNELKEHFL